MSPFKPSVTAVLLGMSACAGAQEQRPQPVQVFMGVPLAAPSERVDGKPSGPSLRESLRHPLVEADPAGKPYRLSAQERLLLRQQLRGQAEQTARDNNK